MRYALFLSLGAVVALSAFTPPALRVSAGVTLSNESSSTIALVYASTCDEDTWGEDLLPVDILEPGAEAEITVDAGCWDFKAITDSGQELEHFGVVLDEDDAVTWVVSDDE